LVRNSATNKGNKMKQPTFRDNQIPFIQDLQNKNEILKDRVKHLEGMLEILDTLNKDYYPDFEVYNHKTYRNTDGNLVTYYTK